MEKWYKNTFFLTYTLNTENEMIWNFLNVHMLTQVRVSVNISAAWVMTSINNFGFFASFSIDKLNNTYENKYVSTFNF